MWERLSGHSGPRPLVVLFQKSVRENVGWRGSSPLKERIIRASPATSRSSHKDGSCILASLFWFREPLPPALKARTAGSPLGLFARSGPE